MENYFHFEINVAHACAFVIFIILLVPSRRQSKGFFSPCYAAYITNILRNYFVTINFIGSRIINSTLILLCVCLVSVRRDGVNGVLLLTTFTRKQYFCRAHWKHKENLRRGIAIFSFSYNLDLFSVHDMRATENVCVCVCVQHTRVK